MDEIVKVCKIHGELKTHEVQHYKSTSYVRCKKCKKQIEKSYRIKNKEKVNLNRRKYRKNNKEKIACYSKKYIKNNKEKIACSSKKYREKLTDGYIKYRLRQKDTAPEIIELKRVQLKIKYHLRQIKENTNGTK